MSQNYKEIFVGKKFEKFERKVFSWPTFFFGEVYIAYRKMLLHAVLFEIFYLIMGALAILFFENILIACLIMFSLRISLSLLFPIWYRKYYNKKVEKIVSQYSTHPEEDKIKILQKKGGTSILFIIILFVINGIISSLGTTAWLAYKASDLYNYFNKVEIQEDFVPDQTDSSNESSNNLLNNTNGDIKEIKNANITGYVRMFDNVTIYIDQDEYIGSEECLVLGTQRKVEGTYVDVFYKETSEGKVIVDYKIFDSETNEEIKNVRTAEALLSYFGLYAEGEHKEKLIFKEKKEISVWGTPEGESSGRYDLTFVNEKNKTLVMEYEVLEGAEDKTLLLEENNEYIVNFEVEERFDYEYSVKDIELVN